MSKDETRINLAGEPDIQFGALRIRPLQREVSASGHVETLEPRVMQVFIALAREHGEVVSRDRLVDLCWEGRVVGDDAINRCIARIRKLAELTGAFQLETIIRVGYRLTVALTPVAEKIADVGSPQAESIAPQVFARRASDVPGSDSGAAGDGSTESTQHATRSLILKVLGTLAAIVVVAVTAVLIYRTSANEPGTHVVADSKPRLAVLPFRNLSPDPANAFFTDGLHEEILSSLANRANKIDVISRTTMMLYRAAPKSVTDLARELGATHVLEGSVRREGQSVRLTVQLIDARSDRNLWSHSYDRQLINAVTLQSEVAGEIGAQLVAELMPTSDSPVALTSNSEAYDFYLKARLQQAAGDWDAAETLLNRAIELDPSFGYAYAGRAHIYQFKIVDNIDASEARLQLLNQDIAAARRFLGADAPIVKVRQNAYDGLAVRDVARTLRTAEAIEAGGYSDSYMMRDKSALLMMADRINEAIPTAQATVVSDPGNIDILQGVPTMLSAAHRPVESLRMRQVIMQRFPEAKYLAAAQGRVIFGFTGSTAAFRRGVESIRGMMSPTQTFNTEWDLLRFEQRTADLTAVLERFTPDSIPVGAFGGVALCCAGQRPTAVYKGWANLLVGDKAGAMKRGREVLKFVDRTVPTRWNPWFLQALTAEGYLLSGNKPRAIEAARESRKLMPRNADALRSRYADAVAARVFAWGGAEDDAVALLEQLAVLKPGLTPGEITRDPLYSMPLAKNERYRSLVARLESDMRQYATEIAKLDLGIGGD